MTMKLNAIVLVTLTMLLAAPFARADLKGVPVGFSQIGAESGWRTAETQSIQDEAEKRGVQLKFSDAQQ